MAFYDRVRFKPSGAPGTGAITVGTAETGFRTPAGASIPNSTALTILAEDGAAWEIFESVYSTSGTSCSRGTLIDSSTGSRISLSATAIISVIASARQIVDKQNGDQMVGILKLANGTVGAPSLAFADADNGLYYIGTNNWAASAGGIKILDFVGTGNIATQVVAFPGTLAATAYNAASVTLAGGLGVAGAIIGNSSIRATASGFYLNSVQVLYGVADTYVILTDGATSDGRLFIGDDGDPSIQLRNTSINFMSRDGGTTFGSITSTRLQVLGEFRVAGDVGGAASHNTLTGTSDVTANSSGVGTIKFKGATSRDSSGFIKVYIGTTAYYVPVFSAITG